MHQLLSVYFIFLPEILILEEVGGVFDGTFGGACLQWLSHWMLLSHLTVVVQLNPETEHHLCLSDLSIIHRCGKWFDSVGF